MNEQDELVHFGVKGMRWGVRNASKPVSPKMSKKRDSRGDLMTKDDAKWSKKANNIRKGIEAYNQTADVMNSTVIPRINSKPEYRNVNLNKNPKLMAKYNKEYSDIFDAEFNKALTRVYGTSPSGKYKVISTHDGWVVGFNEDKVKHADETLFTFEARRDNFGRILEFKLKDDTLIQSEINDYLAHHGIKGMRWGVRRENPSGGLPTPVTVSTKPNSSKIQTKGGANHPASDEAKRSASIHQKLKKSGVNSLSNKEMQELVTRLNLEQQLSKLTTPQKSQFQRNVEQTLNQTMSKAMSQIANQAMTRLMDQAMKKYKK